MRRGRRLYYNLFSTVYDAFIRLHSRGEGRDTRDFLVRSAESATEPVRVLDVCCGTGAVVAAFDRAGPGALNVGYDFSRGMLRRARERTGAVLVEGDAAVLPFEDDVFDVVTCSHALYELKGPARETALQEMRRVMRPGGVTLIMEHEVPKRPLLRYLFDLRMRAMGSEDAKAFVRGGLAPFQRVFPVVSMTHSPTGRSKLMVCRKETPRSQPPPAPKGIPSE